jgi:hypothetical protein
MADRSFLVRAGWILVIVLAGYLLVDKLRTPAAPPATVPEATTLAPAPQAPPVTSAPEVIEAPAAGVSPSAQATPSGTPAPAASASPSGSPTPDPAETQRKQQEEQRIRSELAAAKAKADSLSAAASTECPDLKPGEQRFPGTVALCARLRSDAAQAVSQYEALKQQAAAAGINVP